ncbi:hypothetical protein MNEG_12971 [Monoraphidium neglectum]|uniref:GRAM domain-containing protein n=1 Tax=Monoraphidium neglectum TaxID=145388 RepID=A0A0D2KGP3_9CHLO|nr:hypothetical protein MNEG_12971 [Monoraphidium neglectum]KIY94993.1 hypothetical protein MNEG_12971 [Monoraphidium neglectum]|eukprot:XP_013894013.1 hypothetical protein MNEG_12971 [Monoraphidium neglectum]
MGLNGFPSCDPPCSSGSDAGVAAGSCTAEPRLCGPPTSAFVSVGWRPEAIVDSLLHPLKQEMRTNINDPAKAEALRRAFGLSSGQSLLAHFLCARRKPGGWDTGVVMPGQLLVFSGCMVFQSNVLGNIKYKCIWFENVVYVRKKKVLSLPNSILVRHNDAAAGVQREELFTSFRLASRQQAFALLCHQWSLAWWGGA